MKEKTVTIFEIEDGDYELLKTWHPADPCTTCFEGMGCVGCSQKRQWEKSIKPLKQVGVFDVWETIQELKSLYSKVKSIEKAIKENEDFITSRGFDLARIFPEKQENSSSRSKQSLSKSNTKSSGLRRTQSLSNMNAF